MNVWVGIVGITLHLSSITDADEPLPFSTNCSTLLMGQYICPDPTYDYIDPKTQQPFGCTQKNVAKGS